MKARSQTLSRRDEILEAAARLFKQKGYASTTMREIADQVGMEAASMYNHIKSKDELLQDICFRVADMFGKQLDAIDASDAAPVQKLKELIRLHIRMVCKDTEIISVANHEWKHLPEPALQTYKKARLSYENRLASIIQEGIDREEIENVHVTAALYTILSAIRWIEAWYKPGKNMHPNALEETILQILMNGLIKQNTTKHEVLPAQS